MCYPGWIITSGLIILGVADEVDSESGLGNQVEYLRVDQAERVAQQLDKGYTDVDLGLRPQVGL